MRAIDSLAPAGSPAAGRATPTGAARPMATALEVELGHATRPGPRPANEDFVAAAMPEGAERAAKGVLLAIADGVGGHAHGREAAEYTVRSLLADYFSTAHTWSVQKSLDTVLGAANRWLLAQSARSVETAGMATTLTALVLRGRRWHLAHVGDSRAYLWRDGALVRLSEDHTWPHPELNNVLRRAVGLESRLLVDHDDGELAAGDVFVLLTDGVWNALGEVEIAAVLARHVEEEKGRATGGSVTGGAEADGRDADLDPQAAADALVDAALRAGGNDNASALVARVRSLPADNLHDRLAAGRRLPLPPRLAEGDTLDGLRVEAVLHVSRLTVLYRVCRIEDDTAAFAAAAAPTSPQPASTSPQPASTPSQPAPVHVGAPVGANTAACWVLKTLLPAHEHDEDARLALVREEWLARRVPAQGFPQVADWPARAHLYYLMSWHEGESLKALLARGERLRPHEVAELGARMLGLVGVLHRRGIVHRDIKPDNLHLGRDGVLRLLDLGVAASEAEDLCEINNPGTPSYLAPELFAGQPASEASDLYACGVTLYELLTRKFPYGEVEPFQHPRFGEPVPPTRHRPDTPAWLEAVLLKACARMPDARFETAEEFRLALERGAWQPLAVPRRTPLLERRPTLALKLLALGSLLLNLVLLFLLTRS